MPIPPEVNLISLIFPHVGEIMIYLPEMTYERLSDPLAQRHERCDRRVGKAKEQWSPYSACSASSAVGSRYGKGGPNDSDHDPDH